MKSVLCVLVLGSCCVGAAHAGPPATEVAARPPATVYAAAPPAARDCEADVPANQYNDRLDCKTENVNVQLFDYVDAVLDFDRVGRSLGREPVFTDAERDRAQSAKNRTHGAQMFRGVVKKQKPDDEDCYVLEIIGDHGGHSGDDVQPCEAGEDCQEEIGDGIGDDDGVCKLHGANKEVCVTACQQPVASDEENFDPAVATETEDGLDTLDVALRDATNDVSKATVRMREAYARRGAAPAVNDCDVYEYDLFPSAAALQAAQAVKNVTGATFNSCSVVCNQDAFGWNCEAACLVFAIIDGIANVVNDAFDVIDGNNGSAQLDRVARCTTQLNADVASISTQVGGTQESLEEVQAELEVVNTKLDAITEMLNLRFNSVDQQLCTPQGQRECFPGGHAASEAESVTAPTPAPGAVRKRR